MMSEIYFFIGINQQWVTLAILLYTILYSHPNSKVTTTSPAWQLILVPWFLDGSRRRKLVVGMRFWAGCWWWQFQCCHYDLSKGFTRWRMCYGYWRVTWWFAEGWKWAGICLRCGWVVGVSACWGMISWCAFFGVWWMASYCGSV